MSKDYSDIPTELVTIKDGAEILASHGDQTSPQNLVRYCKRHDLIEKKVGRFLMINPQRVAEYRGENFTTEVMRGTHAKSISQSDSNVIDIKTKSKHKSKNKPQAKPTKEAEGESTPSAQTVSLERSREAKSSLEEAKAEKAQLELERLKNNLVDMAEVEAGAAVSMTAQKEHLLGPNLSTITDYILATLGLPDDKKRQLQSALRKTFSESLVKFGDILQQEIARIDEPHAAGLPTRLDMLIHEAARFRDMTAKEYAKAAKAHQDSRA